MLDSFCTGPLYIYIYKINETTGNSRKKIHIKSKCNPTQHFQTTEVLFIKTQGESFSKFPTNKNEGGGGPVRRIGKPNKKLTCTNCGRRSVSSSSLIVSIQVTAWDLTS